MVQFSTRLRNGMGNSIESVIGTAPTLEYRTGPAPTNPAAASSGTLLMSGTLPSDWMTDASNGVKAIVANFKADAAVASGYAGHYRLKASDGSYDMQGLVSEPWAGSKAYVVGQQVSLNGNVYRATVAGTSASTGGPTGTGGSITDGGVTWAYAGPSDIVVDNTNIAAGQAGITLSSYQLTMPNA